MASTPTVIPTPTRSPGTFTQLLRPILRRPFGILCALDALGFAAALLLSMQASELSGVEPAAHRGLAFLLYVVAMALCQTAMGQYSSYSHWREHKVFDGGLFSWKKLARFMIGDLRLVLSVALGSVATYLVFKVTGLGWQYLAGIWWAGAWAYTILFSVHLLFGRLLESTRVFKRTILVLGSGKLAAQVHPVHDTPESQTIFIHGYVSYPGEAPTDTLGPIVDAGHNLLSYCKAHDIEEIVVALDWHSSELPVTELLSARLGGVAVTYIASFMEKTQEKIVLSVLRPEDLFYDEGFNRNVWRSLFQRIFDLTASTALLVLASPLMLAAVIGIKMTEGWRAPVFYSQRRIGLNDKEFSVLKFRSMRTDAEKDGVRWASKNDPRVTFIGGIMRKTRIDELPQLLTVLRGDMSFVGPRPERREFTTKLEKIIPYYRERHTVRPGITGWAQLRYPYGSTEADALEKLQYDLYYAKHQTLWFDILILLQTVEVVLFAKGN